MRGLFNEGERAVLGAALIDRNRCSSACIAPNKSIQSFYKDKKGSGRTSGVLFTLELGNLFEVDEAEAQGSLVGWDEA